jgi:hypothetical protein
LEDVVMTNKWRPMLGLFAVLVVGCLLGTGIQSITAQEAPAPSEEIPPTLPAPAEEPAVGIRSIKNPEDLRKAEAFLKAITGSSRGSYDRSTSAWQYKSEVFDVARANELGKQGWELVNVYTLSDVQQFNIEKAIYKRPL